MKALRARQTASPNIKSCEPTSYLRWIYNQSPGGVTLPFLYVPGTLSALVLTILITTCKGKWVLTSNHTEQNGCGASRLGLKRSADGAGVFFFVYFRTLDAQLVQYWRHLVYLSNYSFEHLSHSRLCLWCTLEQSKNTPTIWWGYYVTKRCYVVISNLMAAIFSSCLKMVRIQI